MIIELKHGDLDVKLNACNDAFIDAIPKFEYEMDIPFQEVSQSNGVSFTRFLYIYAYFSYKSYCSENSSQQRSYNYNNFIKALRSNEVLVERSNLEDVLRELSITILEQKKTDKSLTKEQKAEVEKAIKALRQ